MKYSSAIHPSDEVKKFHRIRNCMFLSGLSVFAQLYLFQPMLSDLCRSFQVDLPTSSLAVSTSTIGMATGLLFFAFKADAFRREKLMGMALLLSSLLTIASSFITGFMWLLVINFLKGFALSGVSAVALAYLTDEVDRSVIGLAISLYLSGNTIGGMSGRVASTLLSGWGGWQYAAALIGLVSLLLGYIFVRKIPASQHNIRRKLSVRQQVNQMKILLGQPVFLRMYGIAALSMGTFVSVYNYLSILLESPSFGLPHQWVAMIFMMYITGVAGSIVTGTLSDRYRPEVLLQASLLLMCIGLSLLWIQQLVAIIVGLGIFTFAFFSAHTMASRIVSIHAGEAKSSATSIYWLFYYAGSSLLGSLTGIILSQYGWNIFVGVLLILLMMALATSFHAVYYRMSWALKKLSFQKYVKVN